jgi:hypothetical protein
MGCGFNFGDDYQRCEILIDELEYLLELEVGMKVTKDKLEKHNQDKEDINMKIKDLLEIINQKASGIFEINRLQKLNEKYQNLLFEESKIKY